MLLRCKNHLRLSKINIKNFFFLQCAKKIYWPSFSILLYLAIKYKPKNLMYYDHKCMYDQTHI